MGREIRKVPPNWKHPEKPEKNRVGMTAFQPMYDRTFEDAAREWKADFAAWERGERPSYYTDDGSNDEFWEYSGGPPDREYYRDYADADATWFQVYETVTEGTPVTPPFATEDELIEHLVANGTWSDEYDRRAGWETGPCGWPREAAEKFVKSGWAPSMIVANGVVSTARDPSMYAQADDPDKVGGAE